MENNSNQATIYQFGDFELHLDREQLFRGNEHIKLEPQQFILLHLLVSHPSELVKRNQIEQALWAGRPVSDDAFRAAIKKLRDALNDDARAPRYIKTIPKQGLKWLATVTTKADDKAQTSRLFPLPWISVLATMCIALLISVWLFMAPDTDNRRLPDQTGVASEPLTRLPGSEVFADYHQQQNKLVFLHREERSSPQQLFIKLLNADSVQRLSWDQANYSNSYWAHDGKRIAFNRLWQGKRTIHIASLDENDQLIDVRDIQLTDLQDKFVVGWTHDDAGLLLAEELTPGSQHGIHQLSLEAETLSQISFPNVAGRGDYAAAQSSDGSKLAILREVSGGQANLVIMSQSDGDLASVQTLPFVPTKLAWQGENAILMSSFFGDFARFLLGPDTLDTSIKLPDNTLDVFASCGQNCAVMRQHNGDFLDLQEKPLSSMSVDAGQALRPPVLANGRRMKFPDAEGLPVYGQDAKDIYFVSLAGQYHYLNKLDSHHGRSVLAQFSRKQRLTALTLSPDNKTLAGIVNRRLFVLPADADAGSAPRYLTTALEHVDNPSWSEDGNTLYVAHYIENQPQIIAFTLKDGTRSSSLINMLAFQPRENRYEAIGIDSQLSAWLLKNVQGNWQRYARLASLQSSNIHRWKWRNDALYYTKGNNTQSSLCTVNTREDSVPECVSTGHNRFRLSFDISTDQQKILLVDSLGAQSDIIRLTW